MKEQIIKRIKSLLWRAGAVALIAFLGFIAENLGATGMGAQWVVFIGLVLGEVTKYLNNQLSRESK